MQVGDLGRTSEGRLWLNTVFLPRLAHMMPEGAKVLFVGTDMSWDYKSLFFNPSCLLEFTTMDIAEKFTPDIVGDISNCPQIEDNSFDLIILIGVYEFVNDKPAMFRELNRIVKPGGIVELSLPGAGYYESPNNHVEPWECWEKVAPLRIEELYVTGERDGRRPTSVHILARKA